MDCPIDMIVFGSVSVDVIENPFQGSRTCVGGAGAYAALAAASTGCKVGLVGMISSAVTSSQRDQISSRIDIRGLTTVPASSLSFEIKYDTHWSASYSRDETRGERSISFAMVPEALRWPRCFHVCPTHTLERQLELIEAARRGPLVELLTVTMFGSRLAPGNPRVRDLFATPDVAFLNLQEALTVTGTGAVNDAARVLANAGRLTVITMGSDGAMLIDRHQEAIIPPVAATPVDVTGAGEAYGGAFAAEYLATKDPLRAARRGSVVAALCVEDWGIAGLLAADRAKVDRRLHEKKAP